MAYPFQLPGLGYSHDALEPHVDARTMEIHHGKHHAAYTANLNAALTDHPELHGMSAEALVANLSALPQAIRTAVRNNGGGFVNHDFFWRLMTPGGADRPGGALAAAIDAAFGSFDGFREQFAAAAVGRFGSGWAWLAAGEDGALEVLSTANQDTPVMDGKVPVVGVDVWEHAYYLNYQNRRPDYVAAFWNVVNWSVAADNYAAAL